MGLLDVTWTPIVTSLAVTQRLTGTTLAAFQAWPASVQASFIRANSGANPPQVVIGPAGQQHLATLTPDGQVAIDPPDGSALPANFTTVQPADLDQTTFESWSPNMQTAYLQAYGADPSLALGSGDGAFTATRSDYAVTGTSSTAVLGTDVLVSATAAQASVAFGLSTTPSSGMTLDHFLGLSQALQKAMFKSALLLKTPPNPDPVLHFSDTPQNSPSTLTLQLDDGTSIRVAVSTSRYGFSDSSGPVIAQTSTANATGIVSTYTSSVDGATFAAWPAEVQKAYLLAAAEKYGDEVSVRSGPPIAIVFPDGNKAYGYTASLMSSADGAQVDVERNPDLFQENVYRSTSLIDAQTFLSWSEGVQLAYVLAHGGDMQLSVDGASGHLDVDETSSTPPGFTLRYDSNRATPATVSPDLFSLMTANDQTQFLQDNKASLVGSGTLSTPSLLIGSGATQALVSSSGGKVSIDAVPADFASPPSAISSGVFASWSPAAQQRYLYLQKSSAPAGTAWEGATFSDYITYTLDATGAAASTQFPLLDLDATPPSVGDSRPYAHLTDAATLTAQANQLYFGLPANPWTNADGTLNTTLPTVAQFSAWTTGQRAAYLEAETAHTGQSYVTLDGSTDLFVSQTVVAGGIPRIYVVQNLQKTDIMAMSYADQTRLAGIPDFATVAGNLNLIPVDGNMTITSAAGATVTTAAATVAKLLTDARGMFTSGNSLPAVAQAVFAGEIDVMAAQLFGTALPSASATTPGSGPTLPPGGQTAGSAIFSTADITTAIQAIEDRFKRANAFAAVACNRSYYYFQTGGPNPNDSSDSGTPSLVYNLNIVTGAESTQTIPQAELWNLSGPGVPWIGSWGQIIPTTFANGTTITSTTDLYGRANSTTITPFQQDLTSDAILPGLYVGRSVMLDQNKSVIDGYAAFMTQEKAVLTNRVSAASLAASGTITDPSTNLAKALDLPSLLCLFMQFSSNAQQAITTADSEEVNQANAILQDYATMQAIINSTNVGSDNANSQLYFRPAPNADTNAINMFSYRSDVASFNESPIESLYFNSSYPRPTFNFKYVSGDDNNTVWNHPADWTTDGTQLSDAVTQINQQSQIKMNDITNETKQQDRYFDLASTALSKLNETLSQIASAV